MVRKLLVLMFASVLILSLGCAKKTTTPPSAAGAPGVAAAPGAGAEEGAPGETAVGEEELAAPRPVTGEEASGTAANARSRLENEDIRFEFDKYDILPAAADILDAKARYLKSNSATRVRIEGHCDERGSNEYNLALGERRAYAAKKYLINAGVDPVTLETVSYGEERPLDPRQNEDAWAKNRRDHFVIINR